MSTVGGLDPGNKGAIGVWDLDSDQLVAVYDLPNYEVVINKSTRHRMDEDELEALFCNLRDLFDCKLIVIEHVMGMPQQSAPSAFQFGETYGMTRTVARMTGILVETASPAVWKLTEKIPRDAQAIVNRGNVTFPAFKAQWVGPRGGLMHDRVEAAFLARYAARKIWPAMQHRAKLREAAKAAPAQ